MKKNLISLFIIAISIQTIVAQDLKRANHLFEISAYIDAAELYLKEDNKTQEVLEKLGDCYYFNSDMKNASLWYKELMVMYYPQETVDPDYIFKYSQALKGVNDFTEADKWFKIYNDSESLVEGSANTALFFDSLNNAIERPYIIHTITQNTADSEFGVFVQENKILFASTRDGGNTYEWNNKPYLDLYSATLDENGDLTNITPLNSKINTKMHESNGIITKDGQTMYFTRNNYNDGKKVRDENKVTHLNIYKAQLVNGEWDNVTKLPFNYDNYSTIHPALNTDETKLYFSSDMPGTLGAFDLFSVDINSNGTYGEPENLGSTINTTHREQFPFISSTNNLYFASNGHFGMGGLDVFKSNISDDSYGKPLNLSDKINSNRDDFAFSINEEEETGYFSSNRDGGVGDDDIYRFTQVKRYKVDGVVRKKGTTEILPGTYVTLTDDNGNLINKTTVGNDATYSMEIKANTSYTLKGTLKSYNPSEISFATDNKGNIDKDIVLELESYVEVEEKIVIEHDKLQIKINPIYFYFDSWEIIPEAAIELDEVVAVMKKYPEIVIEIGTHTDSRGDDAYNLELSNKRASSVRDYLVEQGISADNVKPVGYGETQIINRCSNGVRCWEREHYENRRCEFVIMN